LAVKNEGFAGSGSFFFFHGKEEPASLALLPPLLFEPNGILLWQYM